MFDMKNIVRSFRIHDITMLVLQKEPLDWCENQDEKELIRALVAKYDSVSRLVVQSMKGMERKSGHQVKSPKIKPDS